MEIQEGVSVANEAAGGNVAVAEHHVAAGVLGGVVADQGEQVFPVGIVEIVSVHDFDLAEVDAFAADVNVGGSLIVKPKLGFHPALIREPGARPMGRRWPWG